VREQFGQVLVEAMACGLPVIAADAQGPAEIVDDGRTGWLVAPDDEDALVTALVEASEGEGERRKRGEAAYDEARAHYAWPSLARGVVAIYDEVRQGLPASSGAHTLLDADASPDE
jgi:glycosyltransferase involved in cell wall biosynthesis